MKLILDIAKWVLTKVSGLVIIIAVMTLAVFGYNWFTEQRFSEGRVAELRTRLDAKAKEVRLRMQQVGDATRRLEQLRDEKPNMLLSPRKYLEWKAEYEATEQAYATARELLNKSRELEREFQTALTRAEGEVSQAYGGLVRAFQQTRNQILIVLAIFLLGPMAWKALWYYGVARVAAQGKPLRLAAPSQDRVCRPVAEGKIVEAEVTPDRPLLVRMDWVQQYSPELKKRTVFLFDWTAPLVSYAAGLKEMTRLSARAEGAAGKVALTAANDPNAYLVALELNEHPGVVIRPSHVVGISGDIRLCTRWSLGNLHSWVSWRLRHIIFCGTGTVYVTGHAGVQSVAMDQPTVVEESLVVGHSVSSAFATARTETFWPYFRNRTSLFDYRFERGFVIRQTACEESKRRHENPFLRTVDAVLGGVGKLLGF